MICVLCKRDLHANDYGTHMLEHLAVELKRMNDREEHIDYTLAKGITPGRAMNGFITQRLNAEHDNAG